MSQLRKNTRRRKGMMRRDDPVKDDPLNAVKTGSNGKNIVICCDGTANQFADANQSNVAKLFTVLKCDSNQIAYYRLGIGTMDPTGSLTPISRFLIRLFGKVSAFGLELEIKEICEFITKKYEPGDRLYFIGFSRGAYTVRIVASLLRLYGVIRPDHQHLIPYAILLASRLNARNPTNAAILKEIVRVRDSFCWGDGYIKFVGVWDTVSSVGLLRPRFGFPFIATNPAIGIAQHAISIDERRAKFGVVMWTPGTNSYYSKQHEQQVDVKQVWFPGVHSDVGGGYREEESGLSKISLRWMLMEAIYAGVRLDDEKVETILGRRGGLNCLPDAHAPQHTSLTRWWWLTELLPVQYYNWRRNRWSRRINFGRKRTIPADSLIHSSAFERYPTKLPRDGVRAEDLLNWL